MNTINHLFANIFFAMLFGLGAGDCFAGPPPGVYGPAAEVEIIAPRPPPPPREEVIIPTPSPTHVWIPGYWSWRNRWVWVPGHWALPPRPGLRWYGYEWVPHEDGRRWRLRPGGWR